MRIWPFVLIALNLAACTQHVGSCKSFTGTYPEISFPEEEGFAGQQARITRGQEIVAACYPLHPIRSEGGAIGFNRAVKAKDGNIYLTYNLQLWSDVRLAFKVNDSGEILGAYQYSTYGTN